MESANPTSDNHQTRHLKVGKAEADIDVEIYDLIRHIWESNIETDNSCQDNFDWNRIRSTAAGYMPTIWIEFASIPDFTQFLEVCGRELTEEDFGEWEMAVSYFDSAFDEGKFLPWTVSARFPKSMQAKVESCFQSDRPSLVQGSASMRSLLEDQSRVLSELGDCGRPHPPAVGEDASETEKALLDALGRDYRGLGHFPTDISLSIWRHDDSPKLYCFLTDVTHCISEIRRAREKLQAK